MCSFLNLNYGIIFLYMQNALLIVSPAKPKQTVQQAKQLPSQSTSRKIEQLQTNNITQLTPLRNMTLFSKFSKNNYSTTFYLFHSWQPSNSVFKHMHLGWWLHNEKTKRRHTWDNMLATFILAKLSFSHCQVERKFRQ